MKKSLRILFTVIVFTFLFMHYGDSAKAQPCSDAGTASALMDSICPGSSTNLLLVSYIGAIQWQSFDGSVWVDETGTGSTTDNYEVSPAITTDYRAVVIDSGCDPDTSAIVSITVGLTAPTGTGTTRCGYGSITLSATGPGIKWYDTASGGQQLATGSNFTTNVAATTTFYAASSLGGGPPAPFTTTFAGGNGFDGNMFDITALNTVTIDSFAANFNTGSGTAEIWYRPGTHVGFTNSNAGWTQAGTAAYTSTGNGAPGTLININVNVTIPAGQTYAFYVHGSAGITYSNGTAVGNIFTQDANIQFKEGFGGAYFNLTNSPRVFNGRIIYSAGCESTRTAVVATVTPSTSFSVAANPSSLCQGQTSSISVTSNNPNYTYNWSPSNGLNTTTGTTVLANPNLPTTYTIVADDGTCGFIDSVFVDVGPASVAGTATASSDTICAGNDLYLNLTGSVGNVQWQSFNGTSWVNESGPGFDSTTYITTPLADITYRAIITSGGCDPDTSLTLDITVLNIQDPILSDTTLCGGGNISLTALGQGNFNWFNDSTSTSPFFTGATYSYNTTATDTFWVEAFGGADYNVGPTNPGIGSQTTGTSNDLGCAFDVTNGCTLTSVKVFPQAAGPLTINLRLVQNGPILASYTANVAQFIGQELPLNFTIPPGNGYRLELAAGSVACSRNTNGASYPYQATNSPLSITGYYSPNFGTGTAYYWFYDWKVSEGCKSNKVPVIVTVNPLPPTPNIGQLGNTLVSSAPSGNQWILNGSILTGQTGQSLNLTQTGTYTVAVTVNGCTSLSPPFNVITISINEIDGIAFNVFPNPVDEVLNITSQQAITFDGSLEVIDVQGRTILDPIKIENGGMLQQKINVSSLNDGMYFLRINSQKGSAHIRFQVIK